MYELSISFFLRRSRKNRQGKTPIYWLTTISGCFCNFSTRSWVLPEIWEPHGSLVIGKSVEVKEINHHLCMVRNKLYSLHTHYVNEGTRITPEMHRDEFLGRNNKQMDAQLRNLYFRLRKAGTKRNNDRIILSAIRTIYNCLINKQEHAAGFGDSLGYIVAADILKENAREMAGLAKEVAQTEEKYKNEHIIPERTSFQPVQ